MDVFNNANICKVFDLDTNHRTAKSLRDVKRIQRWFSISCSLEYDADHVTVYL